MTVRKMEVGGRGMMKTAVRVCVSPLTKFKKSESFRKIFWEKEEKRKRKKEEEKGGKFYGGWICFWKKKRKYIDSFVGGV